VIILDANVIIGFLDANDPHHSAALRVLENHSAEGYGASVLTVAEALVHPTKHGQQDRVAAELNAIGLTILQLGNNDAPLLARIRARYQVRMPDTVALHAALTTGSRLATFDASLATAAREAGITVIGVNNRLK
jgi:predicted nucleic acid-binding protein